MIKGNESDVAVAYTVFEILAKKEFCIVFSIDKLLITHNLSDSNGVCIHFFARKWCKISQF